MSYSGLEQKILSVLPTRVWRTYFGGRELESWLGSSHPADGEFPELWIASTVKARNPEPKTSINEGLSNVKLENGTELLEKIIDSNPPAFLGEKHFVKYGNNAGVLVKIIDSLNRLTIQVHPDKTFAKNVFASDYGKTEAWYIMGGRNVDGENPYVLLGFKPGITKQKWQQIFDGQDVPAMIACLHKIYVQPGEVYFIEGGVPHAIGSGCFLIEIQEPTDYTIRVERKTPEGKELPEILCHQGAGFSRIFDCFHYDGYSLAATLEKWRIAPRIISNCIGARESVLIGPDQTSLFEIRHLMINHYLLTGPEETFTVIIVVSGRGKVSYETGEQDIKSGDQLFLPASLGSINWEAAPGAPLELLRCYPPA